MTRRVEETFVVYNFDNNRPEHILRAELTALLTTYRPLVLGGLEAYDAMPIKGYRLVTFKSNKSRANIAAYVRDDLQVHSHIWHDLRRTWPRTQGPGTHEPRSILSLRVTGAGLDRAQVVVTHAPPKNATRQAIREHERALRRICAPWTRRVQWTLRTKKSRQRARNRQRIVLMDGNDPGRTNTMPVRLSVAMRGVLAVHTVDTAVLRNIVVRAAHHIESIANAGTTIRLDSDHKRALVVTTFIKETR